MIPKRWALAYQSAVGDSDPVSNWPNHTIERLILEIGHLEEVVRILNRRRVGMNEPVLAKADFQ